jgi:serine/threonine-protein kinase
MIPPMIPAIVDSLADHRLLAPERFDELVHEILPQCSEVGIVAPELVYRGWFTRYQMQQILRGDSESLVLGSYTLLEPLGQGGMGSVFRARNWKLDKTVAVKIIRQEQKCDPKTVRRFFREIQALGRISHPNIVLAFDADYDGNQLYYAMEYIPGTDLGWKVREGGPLNLQAVAYFTAQIAHALQHIHEQGLVHRDIKPSNLLLAQNELSVKLLDLGLSRGDPTEVGQTQLTKIGTLIGTPDYIAPEQITDPHHVDIRADLYSLGCTIYYLLSGRAPFEDAQPVEKLYLHAKEEPEPIEKHRPDLPHEMRQIVRRLLNKKPKRRYSEPADLLGDLLPLLQSSWNSSAPTLNERANLTSLHLEGAVTPSREDGPQTQVVPPSQMDLHLPETVITTLPKPLRNPTGGVVGIQMGIAILMATLAMFVLQMTGFGQRKSKEPALPHHPPAVEQKIDSALPVRPEKIANSQTLPQTQATP